MINTENLVTAMDQEKLNRIAFSLIRAIQNKIKASGKWVTGKTAQSLHSEVSYDGKEVKIRIYSDDPVVFKILETGRGAGKVPYDKIFEWVCNKFGNQFQTLSAKKSFAFCVTRKIRREGTVTFRNGGVKDIFTNSFSQFNKKFELLVKKIVDKNIRIMVSKELDSIFE